MANINGWGRGTWGEGAWSSVLPVNLTTAGAMTSAVGALTVDAEANVTPATLAITSAIGSVIVHENEVVNLPSFLITSAQQGGAVVVNAEHKVHITGVSADFGIGFPLVWSVIDTGQTPNYNDVSTTQTPSYSIINI